MIIGVPMELKNNENRVAMTPGGVFTLVRSGHQVLVESEAGEGSGFSDKSYEDVGAEIVDSTEEVYMRSDMIVKVKEPLPVELSMLKEGQIIFTYLHLAVESEITEVFIAKKIAGLAYETVQTADGSLPLLTPMSEVAGRMSTMVGAMVLAEYNGGNGLLLGGVPGVLPAKVVIVGGGTVGINAAKMAIGLGADITILDINAGRLRELDDIFGSRVKTLMSNTFNLMQSVKEADLVIGAVLIPGTRTPQVITEEMVKGMTPGSVIVDVAIDQGGCVETIDHVMTHDYPTSVKYGVVHYGVSNMAGAYARTATFALTNSTLPYIQEIANKGLTQAIRENPALAKGVNVLNGKITYKPIADDLHISYTPLEEIINA